MPTLVLASSSPRRQDLLRSLVASYKAATSTVEEEGSDLTPERDLSPLLLPEPFSVPPIADPRLWAWRKGSDVARALPPELSDKAVVLAGDTVVVAPGELLNKPRDEVDAIRMLSLLRAREHYVVTGFALLRTREGQAQTLHIEAAVTRVIMRAFSVPELEGYVATGEHRDKAGAYALQGLGGRLVERVEGCVTNVVGLPLCRVRSALVEAGIEVRALPEDGYCSYCKIAGVLANA